MVNSKAIKGILFDKDGTLFDYNATWMPLNHQAALLAARGDQGLADELMVFGGWLREPNTVSAGSLLAAHTNFEIAEAWASRLDDWSTEDLCEGITEIFNTSGIESAAPVTDLSLFLNQLRNLNFTLGVATSDSEISAHAMLKHFDCDTLFEYIAGYDSGYGSKPGPGMVNAFCETTGLDLSEVIVVGDNHHDMEMGANAGVAFSVGVLTGTSTREDLSVHTSYVLDDITGIPDLLADMAV
ncbi:MAG: HAD family hydrolase [Rhodospirillales bacterium]|jgi:phosphoglycolate phosphatase|nr:HAD family hydrolase [Rhodospirillales bacterium]